ncbi:MAG: DUF4402 domain-containing protein [Phenylobacterium sp.]|uniref:DUF4402 domain-containing protein n=1 Tax=Phenylobacterium sp. TaxID=1871053 RepID=UPI0025D93095|nr:DUF4402 domain-containing protein [Phenylobacterium sp.]MCA6298064.1 DUF4402 domain-containing protein [Phenylobacterium sp.]
MASVLVMSAGPCFAAGPTITTEADLQFGRFLAASALPVRVTVSTNGGRTTDNGVLLAGESPQPAQFAVSGVSNAIFQASISLGFSGPSGVNLESLTATCGAGSTFTSGVLSGCQFSPAGTATIHVGGTLVVDAGRSSTSVSAFNAITVQVSN